MEIDKYISMRNSGKYEIGWFYKYYLENGGGKINIQDFQNLFGMADFEEVMNFLDREFKLTRVYNENNELIRVYE